MNKKFGKIENGYLRYAPNTVTWQGHIVNNPDEGKLKELGYLPIRYVDIPINVPDGKHYESSWEQREDAIVQMWTLMDNEQETPPESLTNEVVLEKVVDLDKRVTTIENKEPHDEYQDYVIGKWYYKDDKISFNGKKYVCIAPDGVVCTWNPEEYPAYWQLAE